MGHPFFDVLTEERLEEELREFAFSHFQSILTEENKYSFKKFFDECFEQLDESNVDKLQCFNIPPQKQQEFFQFLTKKYGSQFSENEIFKNNLKENLKVLLESVDSRFRYHVLKLMGLTNFYSYLESVCPKRTPNKELLLKIETDNKRDEVKEQVGKSYSSQFFKEEAMSENKNKDKLIDSAQTSELESESEFEFESESESEFDFDDPPTLDNYCFSLFPPCMALFNLSLLLHKRQ